MKHWRKDGWILDETLQAIDQSDRVALSQAITLIESRLPSDQEIAAELLDHILPKTGKSIRIGITGVPGVGKSTFIEAFGSSIVDSGAKLAVLTVDPSSVKSKGSILGDKTRMPKLANHPNAYIRPSPSGSNFGGVTQKTRETILLCEAAGYDVIIVETVGVGQSETAVKDMVDFFLLLVLAGGGDELQGIKRGIMEMADMILVNKADGKNSEAANKAKVVYQNALHLFPPHPSGWSVPVATCSSAELDGIAPVWQKITEFKENTTPSGYFNENRKNQNVKWFDNQITAKLQQRFFSNTMNQLQIDMLSKQIAKGQISVRNALNKLFKE